MSDSPDTPRTDQPDQPVAPTPAPAVSPSPPGPAMVEDSSSRALAEALGSSFAIIRFVMVILVLVFLGSGVFIVDQQERGIILRFGKVVGKGEEALLGPGFHWAWPYPIDEPWRIPSKQIQTVDSSVGWYAVQPGEDPRTADPISTYRLDPAIDSYALSAEGNVMHVRATLRYTIDDPIKFYFNFTNAPAIVTNVVNNAILRAAAQASVDDAYRLDRSGFTDKVLARVDELIEAYDLGITRQQSEVLAIPPKPLKADFDAVAEADAKRSATNNAARSYASDLINKAKGQANARLSAAEAERDRKIALVKAEAATFPQLLAAYRENPELFIERRQTETLLRILTNSQDKIVLPVAPDGNRSRLRLQLNREPPDITE